MAETWGLYARVSSKRQAEDGLSIEAQLAALHEFARQRGYTVCEFVDAGKSAWQENIEKRPAFKEMLEAARAGEIQGVAVTHVDRFSRKLMVTLVAFGELGKHNAGFVSLESAGMDYSTPSGRLFLTLIGGFAEHYSAELSRKVKRGMDTRANKGLHVGTLPFGYCNGRCMDCKKEPSKKCGRWETLPRDAPPVAHPDDAPGVLLAFQTYRARTVSDEQVAQTLNAAGYRSRSAKGRVLWNRWSVATLLTNPTYTGMVPYKGQLIPGTHPAIISQELFDEVQAIRQERYHRPRLYAPKYRVYLFNGIMTCARCGHKMRAQTLLANKIECYRCMAKESKKWDCPTRAGHVKEAELAEQFAGIVAQFKLPDDWLARVTELVNANGKARHAESERRALTDRLARVKKQYAWGDIGEPEYIATRDEIKRALAQVVTPPAALIVDAARYLQNMAEVWAHATQIERRDMIRAIFDEVVCDMDRKRLTALRPKPAFVLLLRQVRGLNECDGLFEITE